MGKSKSSRRWLQEHFNDIYVQRAQKAGWRSRSAFKLLEIDDKDGLIKPGMTVVDLGAAPGGWCQVAHSRNKRGRLIGLDLLGMDDLDGVEFIQGDFTESEPLQQLEDLLQGAAVDLVMSDMAPNMSGIGAADQPKAMYLAELALDFALNHLRKGGDFVVKVFQGEGFDEFLHQCRAGFKKTVIRKPKASRPRSKEVYIVARGLLDNSRGG